MVGAERSLVLGQIAALEQSGIPLEKSVAACAQAATSAMLRRDLEAIGGRLRAGDLPSHAFAAAEFMPPDQLRILSAAEQVNAASDALEHAADVIALRRQVRRSAQRVLTYPLALCIVLGVLALWSSTTWGGQLIELSLEAHRNSGAGVEGLADSSWLLRGAALALVAIGVGGLLFISRFSLHPIWIRVPLIGESVRRALLADLLRVASAARRRGLPPTEATALIPSMSTAALVSSACADGTPFETALIRARLATEDETTELEVVGSSQFAANIADELERMADRTGSLMLIGLGFFTYATVYFVMRAPISILYDFF